MPVATRLPGVLTAILAVVSWIDKTTGRDACCYFAGFRTRVFFLGDSGSEGLFRLTYTSQELHTSSSQSIFFSG